MAVPPLPSSRQRSRRIVTFEITVVAKPTLSFRPVPMLTTLAEPPSPPASAPFRTAFKRNRCTSRRRLSGHGQPRSLSAVGQRSRDRTNPPSTRNTTVPGKLAGGAGERLIAATTSLEIKHLSAPPLKCQDSLTKPIYCWPALSIWSRNATAADTPQRESGQACAFY